MQILSKKIHYYFNFTLVSFSKNLQQGCTKYLAKAVHSKFSKKVALTLAHTIANNLF